MPGVIDADTHISESEGMWDLMDSSMRPRRPVMTEVPDDTLYGDLNVLWLIDGNIFPKPAGRGGFRLVTPSRSKGQARRQDVLMACREITDVPARLADMDRLGVEVQVIYPTLFLVYLTDDAELETALCRAYNDWMADVWSKSGGRLRWVVTPPLHSMEASIEEMRRGKGHGAVGVTLRGLEGDRSIAHPFFFPLYGEAEKLDLPVCIHTGSGSRTLLNLFDLAISSTFANQVALPLFAFRDIVANHLPARFPGLRFGFIEAKASWIPYLLHLLRRESRAVAAGGRKGIQRPRWKHETNVDLFRDYRIYVACEADEDLPYLLGYTGEDNVLIGSDYGHTDPANEPRMVDVMRQREDVPARVIEKILVDNPKRFYGL